MLIFFVLIGAVAGYALGGIAEVILGALTGFLIGWVKRLSDRVKTLEANAAAAEQVRDPAPALEPQVPEPVSVQAEQAGTPEPPTPDPSLDPPRPPREESAPAPRTAPRSDAGTTDRISSATNRITDAVTGWFTTGNVPVRVGVVLSLLGLAFFIREAIDRQLFNLPIEFRLAGVAAFGLGLLAVGWRLRKRRRVYALSLQGGGVAVLYLTAYAAFALFDLLPAAAAFGFLLIFTVAGGTLAVLQDSRALAVLGIVGGFMAPMLAASEASDHVLLFSYYAILNGAVVGVAWFKAWRALNLLGFIFTFGIGGFWGYQAYRPDQFATTEPFLVLFVLMYMLIPVLFSWRHTPNLRGFVDGTLVFGTPIVGFGLQARLVGDTEYGLAISAVVLAALYVTVSTFIHRHRKDLRVLMEAFFGLAIVFLAIAVPLALDARWTSVAWAFQGAAMVWLGCRQQRGLALLAGLVLQLLAGASFVDQPGVYAAGAGPLFNGFVLGAALIALAGWFSGWWLDRGDVGAVGKPVLAPTGWLLLGWSAAWWLWAGLADIEQFLAPPQSLAAGLAFVALTAAAAALAAARLRWSRLNAVGLVMVPAMPVAFFLFLAEGFHPLAGFGWLAWPFALAVYYAFLKFREHRFPRMIVVLHACGYWVLAALVAREAHWLADQPVDGVWPFAASIAVVAGLLLATLQAREAVRWPLARHWEAYKGVCTSAVAFALALVVLAGNLLSPGDPSPLPYVPVLNPLALATLFSLIVVWRWQTARQWWRPGDRFWVRAVSVAGLCLLTMAVARAVHHWSDVAFVPAALFESVVLQTSLSIVWGAAGLLGMVLGARTRRREVWVGGAVLMTVVVVKLFLVDLASTGNFARVVSFLGVGVLLLVVGYFAPVPPRVEAEAGTAR